MEVQTINRGKTLRGCIEDRSVLQLGVQRDGGHAGQRLGDRAAFLGLHRGLLELLRVTARHHTHALQRDLRDRGAIPKGSLRACIPP